MKLLACVSLFALPFLLVSAEEAVQPPSEVVIETTYMPASCEMQPERYEKIDVHYTGRLFSNGNKFDSSLDRNSPISFKLGTGQVIRGWDEGIAGMCLHEKRKLTIPASKGYGARGFGDVIPPNSALVFDVELVKIHRQHQKDEL